MRRGDCPAVFSLEILRRNPCTGEESAPRETGRGTQQLFEQMDTAFCSHNTSAPRNGIFIQIPQGLARRDLRTRTPQGDGKICRRLIPSPPLLLRTRTPQGDGKTSHFSPTAAARNFKNQNPARGRKELSFVATVIIGIFKNQNPARGRKVRVVLVDPLFIFNLRTRTPQGDGKLSRSMHSSTSTLI